MSKEKTLKGQIVVITRNNWGNIVGTITKIVIPTGNLGEPLDINVFGNADFKKEVRSIVVHASNPANKPVLRHYCKLPVAEELSWRKGTKQEKKALNKGIYFPGDNRKAPKDLVKGDEVYLIPNTSSVMNNRGLGRDELKKFDDEIVSILTNMPLIEMFIIYDPKLRCHFVIDYICINPYTLPPIIK